jgi:hypothetical protein
MTIKIATPPAEKTPETITARVIITGGTEPFTYFWGDETTRDYCVLPNEPQTITVTVTDHESNVATDELIIA